MDTGVRRCLTGLAVFLALLLLAFFALPGRADAAGPCADDGGSVPAACTMEIRVWNDTPGHDQERRDG